MVRELRRIHLRLWLVLGPVLALAAGVVLFTRGPLPIPEASADHVSESTAIRTLQSDRAAP